MTNNASAEWPKPSLCPVCLGEKAELLWSVTSAQAAQHFVSAQANAERHDAVKTHIENLWKGSACCVRLCAGCGFAFADPYVAGDSQFYSLAYERTGYPARKWEYARTLHALEKLDDQYRIANLRLLEIGAGNGAFLRRISPSIIPRERVMCTEYSDYGVQALRSQGFECQPKDIRELDPGECGGVFDLICMFQVLEHMDDLDGLFLHLNKLSPEGAHLFIAVPNERRIAFNEANGGLLDMPPNHIGRWTRQAFTVLGERFGWKLEEHELERGHRLHGVVLYAQQVYMRKRQEPGTLANWLERWAPRSSIRLVRMMCAGMYLTLRLRQIWRLIWSDAFGSSQWVHLRKPYP